MKISKILVADDEAEISSYLARKLTALGYEVIVAGNGVEALELAYSKSPDIALLEITLPQMDGHEVCRRIKGDARTSKMQVVMLTARILPEDRARALEAGAGAYLCKPKGFPDILKRLRSFESFENQLPLFS